MSGICTRPMNQYVKWIWVEALRSGEYKQCFETLKEGSGRKASFCALGVLRHALNPRDRRSERNEGTMLSDGQLKEIRLSPRIAKHIAEMNDGYSQREGFALEDRRKTFSQIADWIERRL